MLALVESGGMGEAMARMGVATLLVCLLAALVLGLLRRRGVGARSAVPSSLRVVAQLTLEPRRTVYVVEAAGRFLLVGVGDGPMAVLAELSSEEARRIEADRGAAGTSVAAVLRRAVGG